MSGHEVRSAFIAFFKERGHHFAIPSPVVLHDDPTLLFTNAGMNQFKDVFLGVGKRDYTRAVNSQACIRASGKHNDLEDVGADTYHQTLFEMLGNWSFGDYGKKDAILWAWELLTDVFKMPKDKLYATVYKTDDEAVELWSSLTDIQKDHILKFGDKENFWEMGETGPCGPCSELHIDRGPEACSKKDVAGHHCQVNGDCERYIELWNLVFIQYERKADRSLENLPAQHVDTGAGLERITAYLQGVHSNYDTDLFRPIIQEIEKLSGVGYQDGPTGMPHRVIADHIRTLTFAIADNVLPSNEGRGYVLRRILRRAIRYASVIGLNEPVLFRLVNTVIQIMGDYYTALPSRREFAEAVIQSEEESFLRTLKTGTELFEKLVQEKQGQSNVISGKEAFKLYDTFGFPLDLTQVMATEKGLSVDTAGFEEELSQQKAKSRQHQKFHLAQSDNVPTGGEARLVKNDEERLKMARHHTATHLLQAALRQVLGEHVYQAGSLVDLDRLRFDFSHFKTVEPSELKRIEDLVNDKIQAAIPIEAIFTDVESAKKMGALSLFGEKYPEKARVIQVGEFSMELCGGNHVSNTSEIEKVELISESSIAAGTRRIEMIAGRENIQNFHTAKAEEKQHQKQQADLKAAKEKQLEADIQADVKTALLQVKPVEVAQLNSKIFLYETTLSAHFKIAELLAQSNPDCIVIAVNTQGEKSAVSVKFGANAALDTVTAPKLIAMMTEAAGGSGGGRSNQAQAGGLDKVKLIGFLQVLFNKAL